jgi:hypothetical protein
MLQPTPSLDIAGSSVAGSAHTGDDEARKGLGPSSAAAPNASQSISDRLDWDEFLSRQYAFLSQQILKGMDEGRDPPTPPKPVLSVGSAKIMQKKEQVCVLCDCRFGHNLYIYTPYLTVYLMISLPKYRLYTVYIWFWLSLRV